MATNQTTNSQLNQWEPTDAVQRVDFNTDNAKVDAALKSLSDQVVQKANQSAVNTLITAVNQKADASTVSSLSQTVAAKADQSALAAEITARTQADAALEEKAGTKLIRRDVLEDDTEWARVYFSDIDWDQWAVIHIIFRPVRASGDYYHIYLYFTDGVSSAMGFDKTGEFTLRLYPTFHGDSNAICQFWPLNDNIGQAQINKPYNMLSRLEFGASKTTFQAGTTLEIWGCK